METNPVIIYVNLSDEDALLLAAVHNSDTHLVTELSYFEKVRMCRMLFVESSMLGLLERLAKTTRGMT
jgi:hypothetical protein